MISALAHLSRDDAFYRPAGRRAQRDFTVPCAGPGWQRRRSAEWVFHLPPTPALAEQGWKVHVSAVAEEAQQVLDDTADVARSASVAFKHLPSYEHFLWRNGKNCDRRHAGKFIALFPHEDQLAELLPALEAALAGRRGPYVLSDRRWRDAPVFLRYGVFQPRLVRGQLTADLHDPDGHPVPDQRSLTFQVPDWAPVPDLLRPWLAGLGDHTRVQLPFTITGALSHSNAGGVYRGEYGPTPVVIKEARPHAGLDPSGRDAEARLQREHEVLAAADGLVGLPTLHYWGRHWEHLYLVESQQPGLPLHRWTVQHQPSAGCSADDAARWAQACRTVLLTLSDLIDNLHRSGWAHLDVHPANVLVDPDTLTVSLIDFENAVPVDSAPLAQTMAAPGFGLIGEQTPRRHDLYGLGRIGVSLLWISRGEGALLPEHGRAVLRFARRDRTHPWLRPADRHGQDLLNLIEDLLDRATETGEPLTPVDVVRALPDEPGRDWPSWLAQGLDLARGLHQQAGRRYPAHHYALSTGWHGLGHGDRVIDLLLGRTPAPPAPPTEPAAPVGLFNGLVGDLVASQQHHPAAVDRIVADELPRLLSHEDRSVFAGRPGILLGLLTLDAVRSDRERRRVVVDHLVDLVRNYRDDPDPWGSVIRRHRGNHPDQQSTGLMYGHLGLAWLFARALADDALPLSTAARGDLADACTEALAAELRGYRHLDGRWLADQGTRLLPYLATGSAGFGLVLSQVPTRLWPDSVPEALPGLADACTATTGAMFGGLFNGTVGLRLGEYRLRRLIDPGHDPDAVHTQRTIADDLERFGLGVGVENAAGAMICGDGWRLSGDVATGSAGVLLALRSLADEVSHPAGDPWGGLLRPGRDR